MEKWRLLYSPLLNNLPNEKGQKFYKDGRVFEGDFVNGKREEYEKYIYVSGIYYIGQFLKDKKHGKWKIFYKNGNILYEVDYVSDKMEGYGKLI